MAVTELNMFKSLRAEVHMRWSSGAGILQINGWNGAVQSSSVAQRVLWPSVNRKMFASLLAWTSNGKLCWCIVDIDLKANSVWGEKRNIETSFLCCATWILSLYFQHFCLSVCMPSIKPVLGSGFLHRIYQQQQPVVPAHPAQTKDFNYKNKGCIYIAFTFSKMLQLGLKMSFK